METENHSKHKSVKSTVYDRISCEKICPRSRYFFLTQEYLIWSVWIGSVFVGALAVAVSLFVLTHRQYALYEATHDNLVTFVIDALPYLWIALFALMAALAVYNLRHTKRGYRYPLWQVFGSSMVLSLAGGAALQLFGLGYSVDHLLGQQMQMYVSQEKLEQRLWQNPAEGRLLGRLTQQPAAPTSSIMFMDASGNNWQVDITDLTPRELSLLEREETVRLIGQVSENKKNFHSCGAFPWIIDKTMSREDLHAAREAFVMKVQSYKEQAEKIAKPEEERLEQELGLQESPCGNITANRRPSKTGDEPEERESVEDDD